jgi:hypothetical protein
MPITEQQDAIAKVFASNVRKDARHYLLLDSANHSREILLRIIFYMLPTPLQDELTLHHQLEHAPAPIRPSPEKIQKWFCDIRFFKNHEIKKSEKLTRLKQYVVCSPLLRRTITQIQDVL